MSDSIYINNIEYVYNNIDKFLAIPEINKYIEESKDMIDKYHIIFNTDDRNEVIAKYILLSLYIINNI